MEAQEALNHLLGSLVNSMKELAQERKTARDSYYAEVTGRLEAMRTVVIFLQQNLQPNTADMAKPAEEPKAPEAEAEKEEETE